MNYARLLKVSLQFVEHERDCRDFKIISYNFQKFQEAIRDFERNMADMVSTFIEKVQGYFSQCRDLENQHHEKLLEMSIITLEKVVKNEIDDEISDDLREV